MKKTMLSLAAASLVMGTAAYADVDVDLGGQAKIYYETNEQDNAASDEELFGEKKSKFNAGVQLNANADLGNGFALGTQATFLGTFGIEGGLTDNAGEQTAAGADGEDNEVVFTQLNISKAINNTTIKAGRQTMSKSVSPFMYSEGWNVFKNTVDAVVVSNTDVADTTLLAAYVGQANRSVGNLKTFTDRDTAMVGFTTKAIPNVGLTVNYYKVGSETAIGTTLDDIIWGDAKISIPDVPVKIALQGGNVGTDTEGADDTTAYGVKISGKVESFGLRAAYTSVDDGNEQVTNIATGVKSPLYTQMIYNQGNISGAANGTAGDTNTWLVGATAGFGDMGALIVNYSSCEVEKHSATGNDADMNELDVIYKVKSGGVQYFAAYVMNDNDVDNSGAEDNDKVRFWAAYAF